MSSSRRYVLIRVNERDVVTKVKVVTGEVIAAFDTTGTLTHKYQAKAKIQPTSSQLVSAQDTSHIVKTLLAARTLDLPGFLPIGRLYTRLMTLIGNTIINPGVTQERNRGGALHEAVCAILGDDVWKDDGRFPDVKGQLLEVKLQTATTIDLGLVRPDSTEPIEGLPAFRHFDVRYAVFYGSLAPQGVQLNYLALATRTDFFTFFTQFKGVVQNKKCQIPLPSNFFD